MHNRILKTELESYDSNYSKLNIMNPNFKDYSVKTEELNEIGLPTNSTICDHYKHT